MTFTTKHILVPVDVSPDADRALAERLVDDTAALAKLFGGAKLTLIHVAAPILVQMAPPVDFVGQAYRSMLDVVEARNAAAGRALGELVVRAKNAGATATSILATAPGSVPELIVEAATREGANLIALTTHGRRGLKRLMLGSVAERTAHLSRVNVLLLPPAP